MLTIGAAFRTWADGALTENPGDKVRAFSFNLYEHEDSFAIELIGCPRYDPQDQDWACQELFVHREPLFEMPRALVGNKWQEGLAASLALVRAYLRACDPTHRLRVAEAVTVGFVDGDLHLV